ncbi:MAG: ABC transporter ATP-binding protein, partial [Dehalococcoidia bacterium]
MSVIAVDGVSKRFRVPHEKRSTIFENIVALVQRRLSYEEFWALKDITFEIDAGEAFGIIGENGSGKTTLLRILARILRPDGGSVAVDGRVACILELGTGFQPELSARENVAIYAAIMGMTGRQLKRRYDEIIDFAELRQFEDMKLKNFSSGMYVRLAFSTAVHTDP